MKVKVILFIIAAVFLFQSTSPWEGAAGVATDGELPVTGFFIATNSFPRNTVVDITNIETGKSTRAIVANSLNNTGLLATVSRDAAELIGMRRGSVSRIRILSPSDPIAYQRFTEGLAHETPPFDSGSVIKSEADLLAEVYGQDSFRQNNVTQVTEPPPSQRSEFIGPSYQMEPEWGGHARPEIVDVPRFDQTPSGPFINGQQEQYVPFDDPWQTNGHTPEQIVTTPPPVIPEIQGDIAKDIPWFVAEQPQEDTEKRTGNFTSEPSYETVVKDVSQFIYEHYHSNNENVNGNVTQAFPEEQQQGEIAKDVQRFTNEQLLDEIIKVVQKFYPEHSENVAVVNNEELPREDPYELAAKDVPRYTQEEFLEEIVKIFHEFYPEKSFNEINETFAELPIEMPYEIAVKDVPRFTPDHFEIAKDVQGFNPEESMDEIVKRIQGFYPEKSINEIAEMFPEFTPEEIYEIVVKDVPRFSFEENVVAAPEQREFNIVSTEERIPETGIYGIDPNDIIPGIPSQHVTQESAVVPPPVAPPPVQTIAPQSFSIRTISALDRGQYYVQLASLPSDMVENTIRQFDPQFFSYNPVVFVDRDNLYRILIGPLNQGESAAVLARFRSIGYRDAFVRRGG